MLNKNKLNKLLSYYNLEVRTQKDISNDTNDEGNTHLYIYFLNIKDNLTDIQRDEILNNFLYPKYKDNILLDIETNLINNNNSYFNELTLMTQNDEILIIHSKEK